MPSASAVISGSHQGRAFGWLSSSLTDSGLEGRESFDIVEAKGLERDEKREEEAKAVFKDPTTCELIGVDESHCVKT